MDAIKIMNNEHTYIKRMILIIRKISLNVMNGKEIPYTDYDKIIDFIRNYADKHHHKKEEKILFVKMVENIGEVAEKVVNHGMLVEHDFGRLYVSNLIEALNKTKEGNIEGRLDVIANGISYCNLLTRHIEKEDNVIYKFAQRELNEETLNYINIQCDKFESEHIDIKNKYINILEELERKY